MRDTLVMSRAEAEAHFLDYNLLLLAEQLGIRQAEALVVQAALWPNPTVTIDEINLWAGPRQSLGDELPPIAGRIGKNRQVSIQIEQLIETAGKRRKRVALEEVSVTMARQYFEALLRDLKVEFRSLLTQLQYLQHITETYSRQVAPVQRLVQAYENQWQQGNIARGEYIRLRALELEMLTEITALHKENLAAQRELKALMHLPGETFLMLSPEDFTPDMEKIARAAVIDLHEIARANRPDLAIARLEEDYFHKLYDYERAQRTPDLHLIAGYDRGGNFLLNFIGFGVAMDIPVFNKNQGHIEFARAGIDRSQLYRQAAENRIHAEVNHAYHQMLTSLGIYRTIDPDYEQDIEELFGSFTGNFEQRNISMLEYLDFVNTYFENKKIILEATRDLILNLEELQYYTGREL